MAAQVARSVQAVRPHIIKIKFPPRGGAPLVYDPNSSQVAGQPMIHQASTPRTLTMADLPSSILAPTYQKPVGSTPRGSGIEFYQIPERLKRKPMSEEEIAYINRGGPE